MIRTITCKWINYTVYNAQDFKRGRHQIELSGYDNAVKSMAFRVTSSKNNVAARIPLKEVGHNFYGCCHNLSEIFVFCFRNITKLTVR